MKTLNAKRGNTIAEKKTKTNAAVKKSSASIGAAIDCNVFSGTVALAPPGGERGVLVEPAALIAARGSSPLPAPAPGKPALGLGDTHTNTYMICTFCMKLKTGASLRWAPRLPRVWSSLLSQKLKETLNCESLAALSLGIRVMLTSQWS